MIDIENQVFNTVRTALLAAYPEITVLNDRPEVQQKFPCVVLTQDDSADYRRGRTVDPVERFSEVMFTLDVYTAEISGGKTLAKSIADVADRAMQNLYFSRMFFRETPNVDRELKRFTARYRAVVEDTGNEYLFYRR